MLMLAFTFRRDGCHTRDMSIPASLNVSLLYADNYMRNNVDSTGRFSIPSRSVFLTIRFIPQHFTKCRPTRFMNGLCHFFVFHHVLHLQIFQRPTISWFLMMWMDNFCKKSLRAFLIYSRWFIEVRVFSTI
jgi:hypothetical protein